MKVAVSYLSSKDDTLTTIEKINNSNADFIHCDLMDGKYVKGNNINPFKLRKTLLACKKPLEIHLMVSNPIHYLRYFKDLNIRVIYIHFGHYFLYDLSKSLRDCCNATASTSLSQLNSSYLFKSVRSLAVST